MTTEAERLLFEKAMAGVPPQHRTLTYDQAKEAAEKKVVLLKREPVEKIIRDEPEGYDTLDEAIAAIKETERCSGTQAMSKAARRHPDLLLKYNDEGEGLAAKAAREPATVAGYSLERQKFDLLVDGIAEREGVPRHVAMRLARRRRPHMYEAAYARK